MENKRGITWLSEEVIRILIGALCLILLFFVLYSIYINNSAQTSKNNAMDALNSIKEKIDTESSSAQSGTVRIYNVKGWGIYSWIDSDNRPKTCKGKGCLCMCPIANGEMLDTTGFCESQGACIDLDENYLVCSDANTCSRHLTTAWNPIFVKIEEVPIVLTLDYSNKKISQSSDLDLAKKSLQILMDDINSKRDASILYDPASWLLSSFPLNIKKVVFGWPPVVTEKYLPDYCYQKGWTDCLCIEKTIEDIPKGQVACQQSNFKVIPDNVYARGQGIVIANAKLKIDQSDKTIEVKI